MVSKNRDLPTCSWAVSACAVLAAVNSRQARPTKATAKSVYLRVWMMPSHVVFPCTDVRTATSGLDCDGHVPLFGECPAERPAGVAGNRVLPP